MNGGSHVRNETVQIAASYIREDIISHASRILELIWPPTIEQLTSENRQLPESLNLFFQTLLNPNKSDETESVSRLRDSYSQDFIHAVTKGKTLTEKHFRMALGIHNLTGQRNVVELLNKFGHSMSYDFTCDILTGIAEKFNRKVKTFLFTALSTQTPNEVVLTFFLVDNFDLKTDTQYGGGRLT